MRSKATTLGLLFVIACAAFAAFASTGGAAKVKGPAIKAMDSDYGRILADKHGRALYLFTADQGKTSACYDDCATAWPPYLVAKRPAGRGGALGKLTGTARRSDGKLQATYAGHPLYYYVGDRKPGQVLCQDVEEFGGHWYVVRRSGKAVR